MNIVYPGGCGSKGGQQPYASDVKPDPAISVFTIFTAYRQRPVTLQDCTILDVQRKTKIPVGMGRVYSLQRGSFLRQTLSRDGEISLQRSRQLLCLPSGWLVEASKRNKLLGRKRLSQG